MQRAAAVMQHLQQQPPPSTSPPLLSTPPTAASTSSPTPLSLPSSSPHLLCSLYPNGLAHLQLNRPSKYNALTLDMVTALLTLLRSFIPQPPPTPSPSPSLPRVKLVLLTGAGKAFCAGGDIRAVIDSFTPPSLPSSSPSPSSSSPPPPSPASPSSLFFRLEYELDLLLSTYPLPFLPLLHSLTFGGGCGLALHSPYTLITPTTLLAYPETAIGLIPDVGASNVLSVRIPPAIGMWVGLTGWRLTGRDAMWLGLGWRWVEGGEGEGAGGVEAMVREMQGWEWGEGRREDVEEWARRWGGGGWQAEAGYVEQHARWIEAAFSHPSLSACLAHLRVLAASPSSVLAEWAASTLTLLATHSPTSLQLTFEQLQRARREGWDVRTALAMEYRLVLRLAMEGERGDLMKGAGSKVGRRGGEKGGTVEWGRPRTEEEVEWYLSPLDPLVEGPELWDSLLPSSPPFLPSRVPPSRPAGEG